LFTGPGTIDLPVTAVDASSWSSGIVAQVTQTVRVALTLTYQFTPHPITAFCFGDGSGTACPCGNSGGVGRGCASSLDPLGARLSWSGSPRVSDDTFVLHGAGTGSAPILYFQGTLQVNSGLGARFGDGLRCTSGTIVRLGTKLSSAGLSQYPSGADPRISVQGGIPASGSVTRYYQALYRNNATFCGPATFNLTNAVAVPWFL